MRTHPHIEVRLARGNEMMTGPTQVTITRLAEAL